MLADTFGLPDLNKPVTHQGYAEARVTFKVVHPTWNPMQKSWYCLPVGTLG
jgi:hypothetical protein